MTSRTQIVANYRKATYCYASPFSLLLIGFVIPFSAFLGLLSLLPLGVAGLFFTRRGLALAVSSGDREKKDVGYANLILGVIILGLGLLWLAIAYAMTS